MSTFNLFPDMEKAKKYVQDAGRRIVASKPAQDFANRWKAGEAKIDRAAAPLYGKINVGLKKINDFQYKNRDKIGNAIGQAIPGPAAIVGRSKYEKFNATKPRPPKINTRKLEYGAASFADDAALIAIKAGDYRTGKLVNEGPSIGSYIKGVGAITAAGVYYGVDETGKKVKKATKWVVKNPGKTVAAAGTVAGASVGMHAMTQPHVAAQYNQGGQFQDSYFRKEDTEIMLKENIRCAIDRIAADANQEEAREFIAGAIGEKAMELLDAKKQQIANIYFDAPPQVEEEAIDEAGLPSAAAGAVKGGVGGAVGGAATGGVIGGLVGAGLGAVAGGPAGALAGGVAGAKVGGAAGAAARAPIGAMRGAVRGFVGKKTTVSGEGGDDEDDDK